MPEVTTSSVLEAASNGFSKSLGYNSVTEKDFYSWINSVKAEAWDEGYSFSEPYCSVPCGACDQCMSEDIKNPYLKGECR